MEASRVANVAAMARERWDAQMREEQQLADAVKQARSMQNDQSVPTAGIVFNRTNRICPNGEYAKPWIRTLNGGKGGYVDLRGTPQFFTKDGDYVKEQTPDGASLKVYGHDGTSMAQGDPYKLRIPDTSVVNKKGDCKLFCCCGWRMTAVRTHLQTKPKHLKLIYSSTRLSATQAQWIWWANFWACVVHTTMVFITLHFAYWRWGRNAFRDTEHVEVTIYRFSQVPTQAMIDANLTVWSEGWNNSTIGGRGEFFLINNHMKVNFASLVIAFFAISATFHFLQCLFGAFERWWRWYWRYVPHNAFNTI